MRYMSVAIFVMLTVIVNCTQAVNIMDSDVGYIADNVESENTEEIQINITIEGDIEFYPDMQEQYRDYDGDGVEDIEDNCWLVFNSLQANTSFDDDNDVSGDACKYDRDNDYVLDLIDNCPESYNPEQSDTDNDGIGAECDSDELFDWRDYCAEPCQSSEEFMQEWEDNLLIEVAEERRLHTTP